MRKKKTIKKIIASVLCTCTVISGMSIPSYAENSTTDTIESGNTYSIPLNFYAADGTEIDKTPLSNTIKDFVDDVAIVKKNNDGTYHVTLQIENYEKIDILQVSKPGVIDDEIKPVSVPLGTYNIPETIICSDDSKPKESTDYLISKKRMDSSYNEKYIQKVETEAGSAGVTYYSFNVDTLEKSIYVNSFYSYARATKRDAFTKGVKAGKFTFKTTQAKKIDGFSADNYSNCGIDLSKIATKTGTSSFTAANDERLANDLFTNNIESNFVDGKLVITGEIKSDAKVTSIKVLNGMKDLGDRADYPYGKPFKEYMYSYSTAVEDGGVSEYSDNLLNDNKFSIEYYNEKETAFGKQVKIELSDGKVYYGELRVYNSPKKQIETTDGDVTLITDTYVVGDNAKFSARKIEESSDEDSEYNQFYSLLAGNASKVLMYNLSLRADNEQIIPKKTVELRVKIPEDWDTSKIEVQWYYTMNEMFNPIEYFDSASYRDEEGNVRMEGNELVITGTTRVYSTLAITQKADRADLSEIQDGNYKVNITMWQQDQPDRLSMSNAAVVSDSARLVVKNGKKHIYFDTQSIVIGGKNGYTNGIFWANNEQTEKDGLPTLSEYTPLEYYTYYLNEAGNTDMDSYAEQYDLYYPKSVGFELPESADRDDGVYLNFYVPIMDELQHVTPGSGGGCRTAFMTLSGLEQVSEINEPSHDKSVLVVATDKASKYNADDYTEASYKILADAVTEAQKVISGETSANDSEIVALDQKISDAISGLKEATGLDKYNKVLKNAKALNKTDYTAESWADLQAVINAQEGKVKEENADQASAELQSAIDALVPMSTAISMEKGVYEVQATLTNQDGTANDLNAGLKSARLYTDKDGNVTAYLYVDGITGMQYRKGAGYADADTDAGRLVVALPANVENHKVKVTTESGEAELLLNLDLKSAVKQEIKKSDLESKLNDAKALKEKNYTSESFAGLTDAIATAESVLADKVAFQSEITAAETALDTATAGLVMKEEVKAREELDQAVSDAKNNYAEANYTKDSYENLKSAIKEAEEVLAKSDATADEMKEQVEKLDKAVKALVRLDDVVDKSELNGYIKDASTKTNENQYTDNSWNSFQAALTSAKKVSEDVNATKAEVEKQTKLLNAAYEALVPKNKQSTLFEEYPQIFEGTYSVPIKLLNATSDENSMGNASMVQTGIVRVTGKGEVTLEMNFQSMQFAGMTGYLYKLKKVDMDTVEYNKYNYPVKYEASDATTLEEYTDVYDLFNDKNSEYYDKNTEGNWYPKKLSIPIKLNDNLFYVEVYVPVMESIGEGQGTKVARVSIDWANIKQETGVERDNSVIKALLDQVKAMSKGNVADEYWNALNAAYMTAQDVYNDMNSTQKEIDLQVKALQAAVDAVETQVVDKTELNALIEKATAEANRTDVVYTSATLEALKTAITNAQAVAAKEDATKAEVQAQVTALQTALDGLRAVDKTNLNDLIAKAKAEAAKTDVYESNSLTVLNTAITLAENVAANPKATELEVAAAEKSLTTALNGLVEKEVVDKSKLESKIAEAKTFVSQTDVYTESSLATLQSAINRAQNVMDNDSASQKLVDEQVTKLTEAIQQLAKKNDGKLDIKNLADGVYSVYGTMVKVDKNTYSMSNEAINHTIKLTVKNGKYYITLNFNGLTVGQKLGYLSQLKYFTTGYSVDPQYGNPQGSLADVTVDSYQKNADGTLVSDSYGTNYPDVVTFELIPEALNDGYVPLQVFVPIMDAISSGTGTQPVFLKLDWSSLKATTSDNPDFNKNDNNNNNNNNSNGNNNNGSSIGNGSLGNNTLGNNSLGSSKLGSSSLGSGSSSLKSGTSSLGKGTGSSLKGASSVKTDDVVANNTLWAALLLLGGVALLAGLMEYKKRKVTK